MQNNRFSKRIKLDSKILKKIAQIDEFKGFWKGSARFSPQILKRLKAYVIITSTGSSTRIEGSQMSDDEIERLLRGLKTHPPKGRDAEEVAGYADLLGKIFDHHQNMRLTESRILQFHEILLRFSQKDQKHKGGYKDADNIVVARDEQGQEKIIFRPTAPYLVKKEMDDILYWTEKELEKNEIHPILVIANFIFEFLAIHPFKDGNGRLSRAITNFMLLKAGYAYIPYVSLEEIIEDNRVNYYLALRAVQKKHKTKNEDISPWAVFLLDALVNQTEKARKLMEKQQPEQLLSEKQLQIFNLFNKNKSLSVLEVYKKTKGKIPKVTIKQVFSRLVASKLAKRIGQGRAVRYQRIS